MKKQDNAMEVTFKEDFTPKKSRGPIYRKNEVHAIDKGLLEKLEAKGAKFNSKPIDFKVLKEKRRQEIEKAKRA